MADDRHALVGPARPRRCISLSAWLVSGLVAAGLVLPAGSSSAATPLAGGTYAGARYDDSTQPFSQASARLIVSRAGTSLSASRRAFVAAFAPCSRDEHELGGGAKVRLAAPARIEADGSFHFVARRGETTLRAHGRFTSNLSARLVVRIRARPKEPRNPAHPGFCIVRPGVMTLHHYGEVPFHDCRTHPARSAAESAEGRVFTHTLGGGFYGPTRAYGCLYAINLRVFLGSTSIEGIGGPEQFQLAGPYVAYVRVACTAACGYHIEVKDLRDGSELPGACCWLGVFDLVLNSNATFAFIEDPPGDPPPEVRVKTGNSTLLLDSGEGIDRTSLSLNGNVLSWIHDGAVRMAPLE